MEIGGSELEVDIGAQKMAHFRALRNGKEGEMVEKEPFVKAANELRARKWKCFYPSPKNHILPHLNYLVCGAVEEESNAL